MQNSIDKLLILTKNREYNTIKSVLQSFEEMKKGKLFEVYLVELYKGNGYIAERKGGKDDKGGDVLIYHPSNASQVFMIIQAKNQKRPLSFSDTRSELQKFEEDGRDKYNCNRYTLISVNDYVSDCNKFKKTNMRLKSWEYVISLINTYKESNKSKNPKIELFAHNDIAYVEIKEIWKTFNKAAVVQATGTGKSYIILQLLLDFYEENKVVVAPSKYIFEQLKETTSWAAHKTKFITYQKLAKMTKQEILLLNTCLVIFDEMHRIGAETWENGYENIIHCFPNAKIAGFSATPVRYLDNCRDISKDIFEGNTTTELSLTRAIAEKILPMPTYISSLYTLDEEIEKRNTQIQESYCDDIEKNKLTNNLINIKMTWEKTSGVSVILKKYIPDTHNSMKFIIFCTDVIHLTEMSLGIEKWFRESFPNKKINKYNVVSGISGEKQELEDFKNNCDKNTINILLSVNKLNEGLHIKNITGVILLRKTQSPTIFYQQIGRSIAVNNKNPLIFDFVNNFNNLKSVDLKKEIISSINDEKIYRNSICVEYITPKITIYDIIENTNEIFTLIDNTLKRNWAYMYDCLCLYKDAHGNCLVPDGFKENTKLARWVTKQRKLFNENKLNIDKYNILNSIGFVWNPIIAQWETQYEELVKYRNKYGNCLVPKRWNENKQLGLWVVRQRNKHNQSLLSNVEFKRLNELNFIWDINIYMWNLRFDELLEFRKKYKHCIVTESLTNNKSLYNWVKNDRQDYKNGKLSAEQISQLNNIDFVWDVIPYSWEKNINELKEHKSIYGNCNVSSSMDRYKTLVTWIGNVRIDYKKGKLSVSQIDELNTLGFVWSIYSDVWNLRLNELNEYKNEYGDCLVQQKSSSKLARWVSTVRKQFKTNKLTADQINQLNNLDFVWDVIEYDWDKRFNELIEYNIIYGDCLVPATWNKNKELGAWVSNLRKSYKDEKLSESKVEKLNKIGFIWYQPSNHWNEMFYKLVKYNGIYGDCLVPERWSECKELSNWITGVRRTNRKGMLSQERTDSLNEIGFVWNAVEYIWDKRYHQLIEYKNKYGDYLVPSGYKENKELATWVGGHRTKYKSNKLSQDKIDKLNEIGFNWCPTEEQWNVMCNQLVEYKNKYGSCLVPRRYTENKMLGNWVQNQRIAYRKKVLIQDRIDKLNNMGFVWVCKNAKK